MSGDSNDVKKILSDIHDKGYFDKYGGSFLLVFIVVLIITCFVYYSYFMENIGYIRKNWGVQRCVPMNMPLVGEVFPPKDGESVFSLISDNFNFCLNAVLKTVVDTAVFPIQSVLMSLVGIFRASQDSINNIRQGLNSIRSKMSSFAGSIYTKIYGMLIEFNKLSYKINDTFAKISGVFAAAFQSIMTFYHTVRSFMGAFYQIIQLTAIFFIGLAIMFMMVPFFAAFPAAIMMTTIASVLTTFMIVFSVAASPILDLSKYWLPKVPGLCFSGDTKIRMLDGSVEKISNIQPGSKLHDGSLVTSCFKMINNTNTLFRVNDNILVTGEHKMIIDGKFVSVKECGMDFNNEVYDGYLYCLNTDSKKIIIDEYVFSDYDELTEIERKTLLLAKGVIKTEDLWKCYEGGFHPDTVVEMNDGTTKKISHVHIGDVLKGGINVIATVNGIEQKCTKRYGFWDANKNNLVCSDNMLIKSFFGQDCIPMGGNRIKLNSVDNTTISQTINLLTSSQFIHIGVNTFWEFDKLTDFYLE